MVETLSLTVRRLFCLAFVTILGAQAQDWRKVNPLPADQHLKEVIYQAGLFVAVGSHGMIKTSPNGQEWATASSGTTESLYGVCHGGGRFVAVGHAGTILTSEDGAVWVKRTSSVVERLMKVTHGNGMFVAVGPRDVVLSSIDGLSWQTNSYPGGISLIDVAHGNNLFVAGGFGLHMLVSADGRNWIVAGGDANITSGVLDVSWAGGRFFATTVDGSCYSSVDGTSWKDVRDGPTHGSVLFKNGEFAGLVSYAGGGITTSLDGFNWTYPTFITAPDFTQDDLLNSMAFGAGMHVAVGDYGTILYSPDGRSWRSAHRVESLRSLEGGIRGVAYGNGRFVAVSGIVEDVYHQTSHFGRALWSADGEKWNVVNMPKGSANPNDWSAMPLAVTFGNGLFVAVGKAQEIDTSTDGATWIRRHRRGGISDGVVYGKALRAVTHGAGRFVAVGDEGLILTSTNATSWSEVVGPVTSTFQGVAHGPLGYVAVGFGGTIVKSLDATVWQAQNSGTTNTLRAVTFADGRYIAVGEAGIVLSSTNGSHWSKLVSRSFRDSLTSAAYGGGTLLLAGINATLLSSTNGANWLRHPFAYEADLLTAPISELGEIAVQGFQRGYESYALMGLTYGGGKFVAAGGVTILVQTIDDNAGGSLRPRLSIHRLADGRISVAWLEGGVLEEITELGPTGTGWLPVIGAANGQYISAPSSSPRFFRVRK